MSPYDYLNQVLTLFQLAVKVKVDHRICPVDIRLLLLTSVLYSRAPTARTPISFVPKARPITGPVMLMGQDLPRSVRVGGNCGGHVAASAVLDRPVKGTVRRTTRRSVL